MTDWKIEQHSNRFNRAALTDEITSLLQETKFDERGQKSVTLTTDHLVERGLRRKFAQRIATTASMLRPDTDVGPLAVDLAEFVIEELEADATWSEAGPADLAQTIPHM